MPLYGLLGSSKAKGNVASNSQPSQTPPTTSDVVSPAFIFDESQLKPLGEEAPDLRELNACLEALAVVFPDVQIEVFREMLCKFDGESRLALVADNLLKNRASFVNGRWRVPDKNGAPGAASRPSTRPDMDLLPRTEVFRSPEYIKAARALACHEFKGLSRSAINGVLAESNHSYLEAHETLVAVSSKSWSFSISSLFRRRKPESLTKAEAHPLVLWKSTGHGPLLPCIKSTGNAELDRELFAELILPLKERSRADQEAKDHCLALELNSEEAHQAQAIYECACCFADGPFESFTSCTAKGHMVCFNCVQHSISEAIFGQGWQRSINKETGTLRCPAVDTDECQGCISQYDTRRAMMEVKGGIDVLHKLDQRLADHNLVSSNIPLVRCPFCSYAEVDDVSLPESEAHVRFRTDSISNLVFTALCICAAFCLLPLLLPLALGAILTHSPKWSFKDHVAAHFHEAMRRHRRNHRGLRFVCKNQECRRASCLSCEKGWVDVHVCHESSLVSLRTQVEQAQSMAIKRVCPRCHTSIVKAEGCNRLTCTCGYYMCYVCRKDISDTTGHDPGPDVGYRHFCQHLRSVKDSPCSECDKCYLWETEDTEEVLRKAEEEAVRKWRETEKRDLSVADRAYLETGVAANSRALGVSKALSEARWPTTAEIADFIVEKMFV
ncbi:hypothetical protein B0T26DRAFT_757652 [Lasiosphaeria miniovina]|uniref:RING-type domain-containing protein n=1 Tax=Lasiosphaeria miniovina TaxID=1954250 RepID=A0AA39ZQE0_9PEZI|nr:uncharacterized protein B0T26DRAFT_757652 [Lasiosphaeria miniovina]KAK0701653.1 hypothetical protein B0T26DRAFT_757652 [Lasiosphaeria miniovina]